MELKEAIERLNKLKLPLKTEEDSLNHKAVRLGIDALDRIRWMRITPGAHDVGPLPEEV